jgi:L-fuconolactonase
MEALSGTRLRVEALIRPHHLPGIIELARHHPQLHIIVDHGAKPELDDSIGFGPWRRALHELAGAPNVTCKLSGLLTEGSPQLPKQRVAPYVDAILEGFGPTRTLWGSDWPVVTTRASYHEWYELARAFVPIDWAEDVFHRSALRAYGLETPELREEPEA